MSSRSSAWMNVSSSGSRGRYASRSLGNSPWMNVSAPLITFQMLRTVLLSVASVRCSGRMTRSQSHWST